VGIYVIVLIAAPSFGIDELQFGVSDLVTSSLHLCSAKVSLHSATPTMNPTRHISQRQSHTLIPANLCHRRRKFERRIFPQRPSPLLLVHCGCFVEGGHSTAKYCSGGPHGPPHSSPLLAASPWYTIKSAGIAATILSALPALLHSLVLPPSRFLRQQGVVKTILV
jgi:hypothetical protein